LRGFISVKGVKALGNKLSSLPVTEVTLEAPVEELEQVHEKELQAAREADAQREEAAQATTHAETPSANEEGEPAVVAKEGKADSAEPTDASGQASLF
jgi:hypothetical protein